MNKSNEYKLINDGGTEAQETLRKKIAADMRAKSEALKTKYSKEYFEFCQDYDDYTLEPAWFKDRAFTISLRDRGIYQ